MFIFIISILLNRTDIQLIPRDYSGDEGIDPTGLYQEDSNLEYKK